MSQIKLNVSLEFKKTISNNIVISVYDSTGIDVSGGYDVGGSGNSNPPVSKSSISSVKVRTKFRGTNVKRVYGVDLPHATFYLSNAFLDHPDKLYDDYSTPARFNAILNSGTHSNTITWLSPGSFFDADGFTYDPLSINNNSDTFGFGLWEFDYIIYKDYISGPIKQKHILASIGKANTATAPSVTITNVVGGNGDPGIPWTVGNNSDYITIKLFQTDVNGFVVSSVGTASTSPSGLVNLRDTTPTGGSTGYNYPRPHKEEVNRIVITPTYVPSIGGSVSPIDITDPILVNGFLSTGYNIIPSTFSLTDWGVGTGTFKIEYYYVESPSSFNINQTYYSSGGTYKLGESVVNLDFDSTNNGSVVSSVFAVNPSVYGAGFELPVKSSDKSFSLLRTNVALTSNIKVVVSSDYKLFLESFDSNSDLSATRFKHLQFNKEDLYDELLPFFYKGLPVDTAFDIKYDDDNDNLHQDFGRQYDDMYRSGCSNVDDTFYKEEFECLAPLYIKKDVFPTNFVVFRVDGPGILNLDKDNFKTEISDKLKCVTLFDLTPETSLGYFLNKSFISNNFFPLSPLEIDYRKFEFSRWNGIDYDGGGYTSKSLFMDGILEIEKTFFDLDKIVTDGYKNNKVVFPNIINLKFLFDDTPATPTSLRKWGINRYMGFYVNKMDLIATVTPYSPPKLNNSFRIKDNFIVDINNNSIDPIDGGWVDGNVYYLEIDGIFYRIVKSESSYKIVSDIDLSNRELDVNRQVIKIGSDNVISYNNDYNNTQFTISDITKADVLLIKIDNKYHVLKSSGSDIKIHTDYAFGISSNKFSYWINDPDPNYRVDIDFGNVSEDISPLSFGIYKLNFTDIKDFDNDIVDTKWSGFEYEEKDSLTMTNEPKMYKRDIDSGVDPYPIDDFTIDGEIVNVPASSEYVANGELFRIDDINDTLYDVWRKNPLFCKWSYMGSLSNMDESYRFNNSFYGDIFNRTVNIFNESPNRSDRNLDYFYTINPSSNKYINHSLHITDTLPNGNINTSFKFEVGKYFNNDNLSLNTKYDGDYFSYLFSKKEVLDSGLLFRNTNKYSLVNKGGGDVASSTLFRGIKFNIQQIDNVKFDGGNMVGISVKNTNIFDGYKFSILLSSLDKDIDDDFATVSNSLQWKVVGMWDIDKTYDMDDYVIYYDIFYKSLIGNNKINDPNVSPATSGGWSTIGKTQSVYWSPSATYSIGDFIYNNGDYYIRNSNNGVSDADFWNPGSVYNINLYVIYGGIIYKSKKVISAGTSILDTSAWEVSSSTVRWDIVSLWDSTKSYIIGDNVVYDKSLYISGVANIDKDPSSTNGYWTLRYNLEADSTKAYGTTVSGNNVILYNNSIYMCNSNTLSSKLDNGINIYINKKFGNILVNIYINDNTTINIKNANRDVLYSDINSKLTASNFIHVINNIGSKFGFINNIKYYVIEEDLTFKKYDITNISDMPYIITVDTPDRLDVRTNSLIYNVIDVNKNLYSVASSIVGKDIDVNSVNDYNGSSLGLSIYDNRDDISIVDNDHGLQNINYNILYRYSGEHMPVFKNIDLFERSTLSNDPIGNYKFDTTLTKFGITTDIASKVNRFSNILKFNNIPNILSIYPIIDEFGYFSKDVYIFKSNWDNEYYTEINKK